MRRLRALLVGVAEYDDGNIRRLPCVPSDLQDLRKALESHGYSVEIPDSKCRVGRTRMLSTVSRFLHSGGPEDTLLVYLSGHGFHHNGEDYLVPSDAELHLELHEISVPLTYWKQKIERSHADGVVFLVDACREGVDESMSITHTRWSHDKVRQAARSQVAWIFPCGPGQTSRYVRTDDDRVSLPFSLFARSVVNTLNAPVAPVTLRQFTDALRETMDLLTEEHDKMPQDIRLVTSGQSDADQFELFPPEKRRRKDWEQAAAAHPAWDRVSSPADGTELRSATLALVRGLATHRRAAGRACRSDPWTEEGLFAFRMTDQMIFILGQFPNDRVLSQPEAALLVIMPFLLDTYGAVQVRNTIDQPPPSSDDSWWDIHARAGQPGTPSGKTLAGLLSPVPPGTLGSGVFTPARIRSLIQTVYAENSAFAPDNELGLAAQVSIPDGQSGEHELRERLVGILVTVAYRLTLDATALPGFSPRNRSSFGSVRPVDLHTTLARARWQPYGRGRNLHAQCPHPAVELALREHVARLDELLAHLDAQSARPDLTDLRTLPVRALAFGVGPIVHHGLPTYGLDAYVPADSAVPQDLPDSPSDYLLGSGPTVSDAPVVVPPAEPSVPQASPAPPAARQPEPVNTDDIVRRLLELDETVAAGKTVPGSETLASLVDEARRADPGERRPEFVRLIRGRRLFRPDLQTTLGPGAVSYDRALLSLAFGLPLSYEAYCEVEDLISAESAQDQPPAAVISAILHDGLADVRVVMIALSYWEESQRQEWLAAHTLDADALVDHLADGWDHRAHERRALDSFLWLLSAVPGSAPPPALRPALSRRGYLAERLEAQYADDLKFRVDALHVLVQAAWPGENFGREAVDDTLRNGREPLPPSLVAAVLPLTGAADSELRAHANQLIFLSRRSRPK